MRSRAETPKGKRPRFISILLWTWLLFSSNSLVECLSSPDTSSIRLNKVFKKTHSRRQADDLIASGRVTVNGQPVHSAGQQVTPFQDIVQLDGNVIQGWEALNHLDTESNDQVFEYIKYWKPLGVTCTTDSRIPGNLIGALREDGCNPKSRIFPVGRLDKETSGLIIMTSDGRLPNAALRGKFKQPKTYLVRANRPVSREDVQRLRDGVVITTIAQRDGNRGKPLTAPTLPCEVRQSRKDARVLEITLVEGRNRQIRKMMEATGYRVVNLHRKKFLTMSLDPLEGPGDWAHLSSEEMKIINNVLEQAQSSANLYSEEEVDSEDSD